MIVTEALPDGSYRESTVRQRYEYPFPLELKEVFAWVVDGKVPKISQVHARKDLEAFGDLYEGCCEVRRRWIGLMIYAIGFELCRSIVDGTTIFNTFQYFDVLCMPLQDINISL